MLNLWTLHDTNLESHDHSALTNEILRVTSYDQCLKKVGSHFQVCEGFIKPCQRQVVISGQKQALLGCPRRNWKFLG